MTTRKDDIYYKEHKKALLKRTMVVSQCLDDDIKKQLENIKYGSCSSLSVDPNEAARRYSMIDVDYAERLKKSPRESYIVDDETNSNSETDNDLFSSTLGSSEFQTNNKEDVSGYSGGRRLSKSRMSEFATNLSNEGQYALLKSLEDSLINEIESNRPDLFEKLPMWGKVDNSTRRKCCNLEP